VAHLYPRALGSLFVASYDSQGYGGGILTRLHMSLLDFKVKVTLRLTVSQLVCLDVELLLVLMTVTVVSSLGALSDERSGLSFASHESVVCQYISIYSSYV
jgi:hypothetical protein